VEVRIYLLPFFFFFVMDLVSRDHFYSNVNPVGTTVKILYLKQIFYKSGIFKLLLLEYGG
jgi:hypothetical protein